MSYPDTAILCGVGSGAGAVLRYIRRNKWGQLIKMLQAAAGKRRYFFINGLLTCAYLYVAVDPLSLPAIATGIQKFLKI